MERRVKYDLQYISQSLDAVVGSQDRSSDDRRAQEEQQRLLRRLRPACNEARSSAAQVVRVPGVVPRAVARRRAATMGTPWGRFSFDTSAAGCGRSARRPTEVHAGSQHTRRRTLRINQRHEAAESAPRRRSFPWRRGHPGPRRGGPPPSQLFAAEAIALVWWAPGSTRSPFGHDG